MAEQIMTAFKLDPDSPMPLARQIEQTLMRLLKDGSLKAGDKLPHEMDLCKRLKISRSTVRQALGNLAEHGLVERTRRAGTFVTERSTRSMTIGFFYFQEAANVLMDSITQMHRRLSAKGYDLKVIPFPYDYYDHTDLPKEMGRCNLAGAVVVAMNTPGCREQLLRLEQQRFPFVRMGNKCFMGQVRAPLVTGDDRRAARDAIDYLSGLGHERIGLVAYRPNSEGVDEYRAARAGRPGFQERWVTRVAIDHTLASWRQRDVNGALRDYLQRNPDVTAVIVEHGGMAARLLTEAQGLGRIVPGDVSLVSLEDWSIAFSMVEPGMTAMNLSREKEGTVAVEKLLKIIAHGAPDHEEIIQIPYTLEERGSVMALRGHDKNGDASVRGVERRGHPELARDLPVVECTGDSSLRSE